VKTDRVDARTLCELLGAGFLPEVWSPGGGDQGAAAPAGASRRTGSSAHPGEERAPRRARPQPQRPPADERRVRQGRPRLAGGAPAARRRARDDRRLPAPGRLPRSRDRRGGARAGAIRARLRGDPPADEHPRREPRLGGDGGGGCRRGRQSLRVTAKARLLRRARSARSPVRRGAGAPRPHLQAGLTAGAPRALRGGLDRRPNAGAPCAPSTSACGSGAARRSRSSRRRESSARSAGSCSPGRRTTPSGGRRSPGTSCADSSSSPAIRLIGAGARAPRPPSASSATSASSPSGSRRPIAGSSTTGSRSRGEKVRVRHGGARLEGISKEPSSAADLEAPDVCALARRHPHREGLCQKGGRRSRGVDFHPSRNPAAAFKAAASPEGSGLLGRLLVGRL
jgi:hypothetical protein